jgi:hypothetical protein
MQKINKQDIPQDQIGTVVTMLVLRASFESVGHFFRRAINNDMAAATESLAAKFDAFEKAEGLRKAGGDLLDQLFERNYRRFKFDEQELQRAFADAADVNPDAALIVHEFLKNGFCKKLEEFAIDEWNPYYIEDPYFLSPFQGSIVVKGKLVFKKNTWNNGYADRWIGGVSLHFKLRGTNSTENWVINSSKSSAKITSVLTFALPGWVRADALLNVGDEEMPLSFKFPPVIRGDTYCYHPRVEVMARNIKTGKPIPEWKGEFTTNYVQGDLTLINQKSSGAKK